MEPKVISPPQYDLEDLTKTSQAARELYIEKRLAAWTGDYEAVFAEYQPLVERLFKASNDLTALTGAVLKKEPDLVPAARYLAGPPVSADDLDVLIRGKHRSPTSAAHDTIAKVISAVLDPVRFPWLGENREPTLEERRAALLWTVGLWALETTRTRRRTQESGQQQAAVTHFLKQAGFEQVKRPPGGIHSIDVLKKGTFTQETRLVNAKCDLPVRLRDGRLLAVECKVSGTDINSVKRLLRETGGKAEGWRRSLGEAQVIPAAVLAGSFLPSNLAEAQSRYHIFIVWDHDFSPLGKFLDAAV